MNTFEKKLDSFVEIVEDWRAIDRPQKLGSFFAQLDESELLLLVKNIYLIKLRSAIKSNAQDRECIWSDLDKKMLEKVEVEFIQQNFIEDTFSVKVKNKLELSYLRYKDTIIGDFSNTENENPLNKIWEKIKFPEFKSLLEPDEQAAFLFVAEIKRFESKVLENNLILKEKRDVFYQELLCKLAQVYFSDVKYCKKDKGRCFYAHYKNLTSKISKESVNEMVTNQLNELLKYNLDIILSAILIKKLIKENNGEERKKIIDMLGLEKMVSSIVDLDKNGKNIIINKKSHKIISNLNALLKVENINQYISNEIKEFVFNHNINVADNWEKEMRYYLEIDVLPLIKKIDYQIGSKIKLKKMNDSDIVKLSITDDMPQEERVLLKTLFKNVLKIGFLENKDERLRNTEIVISDELMKYDRSKQTNTNLSIKKSLKF